MKKVANLLFLFFLLSVNSSVAQDDVLSPFDATTAQSATQPVEQTVDPEKFITEDYQIPSYNLYLQDWNTEYVKIKSLGISFGNSSDIKVILVDNNNHFSLPCANCQLTSKYGQRKSGMHTGIDLAATLGDPVYACFDGVVRMARNFSSYGNTVVVRHYNGLETVYAHLDSILVQPNQKVTSGQQIGMAGNTGHSSGVHLHFETRFLYEHFDPEKMVDFTTGEVLSNVLTITKAELDFASDADETQMNATSQPATSKPAPKPAPASANSSYYVVKQGDTLYGIAKKNNVSVEKLMELNHISDPSKIAIDQKLRVR